MTLAAALNGSVAIGGKTFQLQKRLEGRYVTGLSTTFPGAKPGALTTRTDAASGTLTMEPGHGVEDGDSLYIFWEGGYRSSVVTTVAGDSVPILFGSGDDLPPEDTELLVQLYYDASADALANLQQFFINGDNVLAFAIQVLERGVVVGVTAEATGAFDFVFTAPCLYEWHPGNGRINPFTGTGVSLGFYHASSVPVTVEAFALMD